MILFLTNAERPQHRRDLLNFICHPRGSPITIDYRHCWIEPVLTSTTQLSDRNAAIFYYNPVVEIVNAAGVKRYVKRARPNSKLELAGDEKVVRPRFVFYPVRYAEITNVVRNETSTTYFLKLNDWYRYHADHEKSEASIHDLQQRLQEVESQCPDPSRDLDERLTAARNLRTFFVIDDAESKVCPINPNLVGNASWVGLTAFLRNVPGLDDCTFTCSFDPKKAESNETITPNQVMLRAKTEKPWSAKQNLLDLAQFERAGVKSGSHHSLFLFSNPGPRANPKPPALQVDPNVATVIGPLERQRGGGIETIYEINFARVTTRRAAFVRVTTPPLSDPVKAAHGQIGVIAL